MDETIKSIIKVGETGIATEDAAKGLTTMARAIKEKVLTVKDINNVQRAMCTPTSACKTCNQRFRCLTEKFEQPIELTGSLVVGARACLKMWVRQ